VRTFYADFVPQEFIGKHCLGSRKGVYGPAWSNNLKPQDKSACHWDQIAAARSSILNYILLCGMS